MRWTKELLINELRKTSTNGYAISARENAALRGAACRLFGTWSAACDAAGLKVVSAPKELGRCIVRGCGRKARSSGSQYCEMHYYRLRRTGSTNLKERPPVIKHTGGYLLRYAPNHPLAITTNNPRVYEHRLVFYDAYGEGPFKCHWCGKEIHWSDMHVDHLNAIVTDNRLENLVASCPACNQQRGKNKMIRTMRDKYGYWIEFHGERKLLRQWAKGIGITASALRFRLKAGWPLDRALTEPRNKFGPRCHEAVHRQPSN